VERIGARPTAEINGMGGGYQGEGSKTVLPAEAFFKVTFRLVANQNPETILKLARRHFESTNRRESGWKSSMDTAESRSSLIPRALKARRLVVRYRLFLAESQLSRARVARFPSWRIFKEFGYPALLLALASPDCRAHSPNENFPVENFLAGIRLNQALLKELAV
jgi:acetylornithine deacetylase/succinyl-diaminopimelate desuccinylase-like protein